MNIEIKDETLAGCRTACCHVSGLVTKVLKLLITVALFHT